MNNLQVGSTGLDVQRLQAILAMLVPGPLAVDGQFGPATKVAVQAFQTSVGLPSDGIVGPLTADKIQKALAGHSENWLHTLALKIRSIFGSKPTGFERFEWGNQGPYDDEHPFVPIGTRVQINQGEFKNGWYSEAKVFPTNPGRVGPPISPRSVVVHTTDCQPGSMPALLVNTQRARGDGGGYHFLIGKQPARNADDISGGIVQLVSILRNGNHAGGRPSHGWFKTKAGALIHPNTCTVGIELDNAGLLKKVNGKWIHTDSGREIKDPFIDAKGRGWEWVTLYQLEALKKMLLALDAVMPKFEEGVTVVPNGTYKANGVYPEAIAPSVRVVGHFSLDPTRKNDPGPQVMDFLRDLHTNDNV